MPEGPTPVRERVKGAQVSDFPLVGFFYFYTIKYIWVGEFGLKLISRDLSWLRSLAKIAEDLNKGFNLGLSSDLMLYRTAEDLCRARGDEEKMATVVFGASNGTRLAEVLKENGINVSCSATPGWRLAGQRVKEMEDRIKQMGKDEVLFLYGLDASVFV